MLTLALVVAAYLVGSIPFAVVVSRLFGLADPRSYGSGNPGATNVLRGGNKLAAVLTLLGDLAKGWIAVFAVKALAPGLGTGSAAVALVCVAVFLGHVFPVFLKFKGGKGVATAAGVLLALDPLLGLVVLGIWIAVAAIFRYSSLAAIAAAAFAPFVFLQYGGGANEIFAGVAAMSAILILRHAENIRRLAAGKESRIGQKKKDQPADRS